VKNEKAAQAGAALSESAATKRPNLTAQDNDANGATASDMLRQLGRDVIGCGHLLGADERLEIAAARAVQLVATQRISRTAAATVLSVAAQATGIGQADALAVIREAFGGDAR
jgi:hypothetical protein